MNNLTPREFVERYHGVKMRMSDWIPSVEYGIPVGWDEREYLGHVQVQVHFNDGRSPTEVWVDINSTIPSLQLSPLEPEKTWYKYKLKIKARKKKPEVTEIADVLHWFDSARLSAVQEAWRRTPPEVVSFPNTEGQDPMVFTLNGNLEGIPINMEALNGTTNVSVSYEAEL